MNSRNFFAELKRRNVYKVAAAYADDPRPTEIRMRDQAR